MSLSSSDERGDDFVLVESNKSSLSERAVRRPVSESGIESRSHFIVTSYATTVTPLSPPFPACFTRQYALPTLAFPGTDTLSVATTPEQLQAALSLGKVTNPDE